MSVGAARTTAQCKVNLFLHVLAREDVGFHQIETLFCRLDLGDEIVVETGSTRRSLKCGGIAMPPDGNLGEPEANLAWRAADAYAAATGWPAGFSISIDKRIPVGGGLGGGSADAGAVLRCLEALAPAPLGAVRLLQLAATLGSDVPFLTLEDPLALAWGRGERLLALPPLPAREVTLACAPPGEGVATADAYGWIRESRGARETESTLTVRSSSRRLAAHALAEWAAIEALMSNDFEEAVLPRHRLAGEMYAALRHAGGGPTLLAGSGATVFQLGRPAARPALPDGARVIETRTAMATVGVQRLK